ncbi:hypothetical protein CD139_01105 [Staphylococcus piscifermentans]|uniref:Uncharacterized protein n=1 Tax=Staphylococcus piscifermentans TaxID=70258 RepID=A0A512QJV6_9STAP|nr:hypothetical protein [Staphylococcus piscifermentans]RTX86449.1 hypothetical protein CD139_01105 [Staphylococcus piscifermentans]GEP83734.1 hypothetical protein SPI02_03190 [Staphylococcus piscifermentans]
MDKNDILTQSLLAIAGILLICIGSFAMTTQAPSVFIAILYLLVGIVILVSVLMKYLKRNRNKH